MKLIMRDRKGLSFLFTQSSRHFQGEKTESIANVIADLCYNLCTKTKIEEQNGQAGF